MATARATSTPESFAELVESADGRHPIELFSDLAGAPGQTGTARLYVEATTLERPDKLLPQGEGLALPHPLDSEWRFQDATADALLGEAIEQTAPGGAIYLLGVPTVVLSACRSSVDRRFVVDCEDNVVGAALQARVASDPRFGAAPEEGCGAAIVDPPWYPPVYHGLLAQAGAACCLGGLILAGFPADGVRPGAAAERRTTLAVAAAAGLDLENVGSASLRYRSPAFELAAMRAAGLGAWLPAWRRGDLLRLRKSRCGQGPRLPRARAGFELTLQGVRLRLLAKPGEAGLRPLVSGEVFPSVSARAPDRARANLWTSGNRAFVCDAVPTLFALQSLAESRSVLLKGFEGAGKTWKRSLLIDPTPLVAELSRIVARESAQTTELVGESSWDRNVNDARFLNGSLNAFLAALAGATG